jgi:hypothetical protein
MRRGPNKVATPGTWLGRGRATRLRSFRLDPEVLVDASRTGSHDDRSANAILEDLIHIETLFFA